VWNEYNGIIVIGRSGKMLQEKLWSIRIMHWDVPKGTFEIHDKS
jgi:hypothetical protein